MLTEPPASAVQNTPAPELLDDLLLDAQHELEALDLPTLGDAVARARVELIRQVILDRGRPIAVVGVPDERAPAPTSLAPDLGLAERFARLFHEHYVRLAHDESADDFEGLPDSRRSLMISTSAACLSSLFPPAALEAAAAPV